MPTYRGYLTQRAMTYGVIELNLIIGNRLVFVSGVNPSSSRDKRRITTETKHADRQGHIEGPSCCERNGSEMRVVLTKRVD